MPGGKGDVDESGQIGAEEVLRSNQYREPFLLERISGAEDVSRPYLTSLPQSYA